VVSWISPSTRARTAAQVVTEKRQKTSECAAARSPLGEPDRLVERDPAAPRHQHHRPS
jgi:hypothetical protein